jgi:hypothetical protein
MGWQHCFRLKQPMKYPIPWLTLVVSATIGSICYHRLSIRKHWVPSVRYPLKFWSPTAKLASPPNNIGSQLQSEHGIGIVIGFHRSPNIPGLVKTIEQKLIQITPIQAKTVLDISNYLMEDPYCIPSEEVAVPKTHSRPNLTEALEIVNKARATLTPEEINKLNNATGKIF